VIVRGEFAPGTLLPVRVTGAMPYDLVADPIAALTPA
jgi:hypothetical protein